MELLMIVLFSCRNGLKLHSSWAYLLLVCTCWKLDQEPRREKLKKKNKSCTKLVEKLLS